MAKITGKKRHSIRKSQIDDLFLGLEKEIGTSASLFRGASVELLETSSGITLYLIDRKPLLMQRDGFVFPTLKGLLDHPFPERRVVVDAGAVSFVINGADVMRPGIVSLADDIVAGRPVHIAEVRHMKPLALGIALFDSGEMREKTQGKVIKTFHYVGDDLWNLEF
jgi:PUA domain protein